MAKKIEKSKLTDKQLLCAKLYVQAGPERGNKTKAYTKAFGKDLSDEKEYNYCRSSSNRLFTNDSFLAYLNPLIEKVFMVDDNEVDRELNWLILQREHLSSKVAAIKVYNKLKGRAIKTIKHIGGSKEDEPLKVETIHDIEKEIARLKAINEL